MLKTNTGAPGLLLIQHVGNLHHVSIALNTPITPTTLIMSIKLVTINCQAHKSHSDHHAYQARNACYFHLDGSPTSAHASRQPAGSACDIH